jgi:hypothetical protein
MRRGRPSRLWAALSVVTFLLGAAACKRRHVALASVPDLGYPACAGEAPSDAGVAVASGRLGSGPYSQEKDVLETFELERTSCGYVFRSRQEWPLDISDVEVRYDENFAPTWAWKRMTVLAATRPDGNADTRRYELRTGDVFIKRAAKGEVRFEQLLPGGRMPIPPGARIGAVIGPGRGILTPWLKRADLPVGAKARELVLDFRELVESLEMATLVRHEDQVEPSLGGKAVRVYTFFGRDTVFADDDNVVIGDLAGMRPSASLPGAEPAPLPTYGGPDPQHTP